MEQHQKVKDKEEGLSLEEAFGQVEETIALLEEDDITLEASFQAYQEGMKLLQYCNLGDVWRNGRTGGTFYGGNRNDT